MTHDDDAPKVSVVVSTYNRAPRLPGLVRALENQSLAPTAFEVVIVDDGSTDGTANEVGRLAAGTPFELRLVRRETNAGPATGRNAGAAAARGALLAFTDDDCQPTPDWLATIVRATAGREDVVVVGRVDPQPGHSFGPYTRSLSVRDARYFQTANTSYPRPLFHSLGGFDERYRRPGGEDTDLGLRALEAGAEAVFADDALVHHDVWDDGLQGALGLATRWIDVGRVVHRHPHTRQAYLHWRVFWRRSHAPTLLAAAGLTLAARRPEAALFMLPWVVHRTMRSPMPHRSRGELVRTLPGVFLVDLTEVATMVRASVRGRTLVL